VTQAHASDFAPKLAGLAPQLALTFSARSGRTYLSAQRSTHPFHLGRVLYRPDDAHGLATVYMQGCAGGLFEHDRIEMTVRVERGARAHLTTAAASIVHRMPHAGHAEQHVSLVVDGGALLEYCPDPLIMFPTSRLRSTVRVTLGAGARAIITDAFMAHQLRDDDAPFAWLDARTVVENAAGELMARESYRAQGAILRAQLPGVSGRYSSQASVWVLGDVALPELRAAIGECAGATVGVSPLPESAGAIARILAEDGVALRNALRVSWHAARGALGERAGRQRPK
jgi:urease accessory protein